ncbi:MAG: DNA-formamidopyrimidine glycosylase family protein, partial [Candidatus Thorarchaeota archaeon]
VSIEMPEARILATQMQKELVGKTVQSWKLEESEKQQKSGMVNENLQDFDCLKGRTIQSVRSRGNIIRVKLGKKLNLLVAPEYGGTLLYHENLGHLPKKTHLILGFADETAFTIRLKGWGHIYAVDDSQLKSSYVYARDFSDTMAPDEEQFTYERFSEQMRDSSRNIKMALVGKDAVVVGLSNSAFQDIVYRAKVHPKRKSSDMSDVEMRALYDAVQTVVQKRLRLGGKTQFVDLYGIQGRYSPVMGPNMKGESCPTCGNMIEKFAHGGGHVYLCPECQK